MDFITYQQTHQQRFLNELVELLKIPSVSAQQAHYPDCVACAQQVAHYLKNAGADFVDVMPTKGNPIVYGEKIINPKLPTVLVYGHYDVQPVDPIDLWHTPPFNPTIKDGKIYARGASDDKGQMYMHIKAFESLCQTNSLPLNVKFLIEGEEEIGCLHLEDFIKKNKTKLKADVILISDSAMLSLKKPSIETGLRGLVYMELELTTAQRDLHSGVYGGAVANPITLLTQLLSRLHDKNNRITIPHFYEDVKTYSASQRARFNEAPYQWSAFKKETGAVQEWGEKGYTTLERIGIRPTLEINGIWGGYTGSGAKTVLPNKAFAKISCRLVPNQSSQQIQRLVTQHLKAICPPAATLKITLMQGGEPYQTDLDSIEYEAASQALHKVLKKRPIPIRGGGSIPVVANFEKHLNIKSILLGFGLNDDNLHAPNEKFDLVHFYKGIETIAHFYHIYARLKGLKK